MTAAHTDSDAFRGRAATQHLAPLWTRLKSQVRDEPAPIGIAHRWRYDDVRPLVIETADQVSVEEAQRRALNFENPGLPGSFRIANAVVATLQLLMPGEVAPAHRHTQSALRFVVEGQGGYTVVAGEKLPMEPGDLIITPPWTYHLHGHEGDGPMIWLDGLDAPLVGFFNCGFQQDDPGGEALVTRPPGDGQARYGSGLLPIGSRSASASSPVFRYPYGRTRETLRALARAGEPDAHNGHLMHYANPLDGGWVMPTLATMIRLLPKGFATLPYRSTDSVVMMVVEGEGRIRVSGSSFSLSPHDIIVVPGWLMYSLHADLDLVLFSYSDRAAQEKLGLFREQRAEQRWI